MENRELRLTAAGAGVRLWKIAEVLGIADYTLSRRLRRELPAEEKQKILKIIEDLAQEVSR